jgi:voltage-gated potassium channel Kch
LAGPNYEGEALLTADLGKKKLRASSLLNIHVIWVFLLSIGHVYIDVLYAFGYLQLSILQLSPQ